MRLRYDFDIATVADEMVLVPIDIDGRFNGVITINETMKDIIELLTVDRSEKELTVAMMQKYKNVTHEEMEKSIHTICVDLKNEGLLE